MCLVLYQVLHSAKVGRHVACCCISTPLPRSWRTARALWWYMRGDAIQDRPRPAVYRIPRYCCSLYVLLLVHACTHASRCMPHGALNDSSVSCSMCRGAARTHAHARTQQSPFAAIDVHCCCRPVRQSRRGLQSPSEEGGVVALNDLPRLPSLPAYARVALRLPYCAFR